MKDDRTEIFQGEDGQWRWHRIAGNNRIIATSGEGFDSKSNAERASTRAFAAATFAQPVAAPRVMPKPAPDHRGLLIAAALSFGFIVGLLIGLWLATNREAKDAKVPAGAVTTSAPTSTTVTFGTATSGGTVITDGHTTLLAPTTTVLDGESAPPTSYAPPALARTP